MNTLSPQRSFAAYGASHWAVLLLLAAGVLVLAWLGGRYRGTDAVQALGRLFAVVLALFHVPILIYDLTPSRFDIANSLPFHTGLGRGPSTAAAIHRSDDGGATWEPVGTSSATPPSPARTSGMTERRTHGSSRECGT